MDLTNHRPARYRRHHVRSRPHRPYSRDPRRPRFRRPAPAPPRRARLGRAPRRRPAGRRERPRGRRRPVRGHRRARGRSVPPHRRRRRPAGLPGTEAAHEVSAASEAAARPLARGRAEAPPTWKLWTALWIVYLVWGSTYLAISLMVETIPPLFGAGARFVLVGAIVLPVPAVRRGLRAMRPSRRELLAAGFVGLMLPGANAVISVAEKQVPSGLAALLVASIPLWVILLRAASGERVPARSIGAVLVGFGGLLLLLRPAGDAPMAGLLACVGGAFMWAIGSFASPRISLPRDPLASVAWQSLLGGLIVFAAGVISGEL